MGENMYFNKISAYTQMGYVNKNNNMVSFNVTNLFIFGRVKPNKYIM